MKRKPAADKSIRQSKEALLEAAQAAVADQRNRPLSKLSPSQPPPGKGRLVFRGSMLVAMTIGAGLLAAQPAWLTGPKLPKEDQAVQAASATLTLVDAVSKVQSYFASRGRLPRQLREAGIEHPAVQLRVTADAAFEVSLRMADSTISIRSDEPIKPRMVAAIRILQRRS